MNCMCVIMSKTTFPSLYDFTSVSAVTISVTVDNKMTIMSTIVATTVTATCGAACASGGRKRTQREN